jgi:hypothetical protein
MRPTKLTLPVMGLLLIAHFAQADWLTSQRLTWSSGSSENPAIAVDPYGTVHVVWNDNGPGNSEIYYKKSTNEGLTWTAGKRLTWSSGYAEYPAIAADPYGNLHLIWDASSTGNTDIFYKKSTDGGDTWTTNRRLTWTSGLSMLSAITVDSFGRLHVVWMDTTPGNCEIYYKKSTDGGGTWAATKRLTLTGGYSFAPAIAVDSLGYLNVVWYDDSPGNYEIYFKKSTDAGDTWSPSQRLTWNAGDSEDPAIIGDASGNIYIIWDDGTPGNDEIYFRMTWNGGASWSTSQRITWTAGISDWPAIALGSSGKVHAVFGDDTPGNDEIYYKKSPDGGTTWTMNQRLTWNAGTSRNPAMTNDGSGNLHLVWEDFTPGKYAIYYKKGSNL